MYVSDLESSDVSHQCQLRSNHLANARKQIRKFEEGELSQLGNLSILREYVDAGVEV